MRELRSYTVYTLVVDSTLPLVLVCVVVRTSYPELVLCIRCTCDRILLMWETVLSTMLFIVIFMIITTRYSGKTVSKPQDIVVDIGDFES